MNHLIHNRIIENPNGNGDQNGNENGSPNQNGRNNPRAGLLRSIKKKYRKENGFTNL